MLDNSGHMLIWSHLAINLIFPRALEQHQELILDRQVRWPCFNTQAPALWFLFPLGLATPHLFPPPITRQGQRHRACQILWPTRWILLASLPRPTASPFPALGSTQRWPLSLPSSIWPAQYSQVWKVCFNNPKRHLSGTTFLEVGNARWSNLPLL